MIPRTYPSLSEGAVPTVFPNLPKYISRTLPKERKRRNVSEAPAPCKRSRACVDTSAECPSADVEAVNVQPDAVPKPVAEEPFIFKLKRPSELWSLQKFKQSNIACYQTADFAKNETPPVVSTKMVVFVVGEGLPSCRIFVGGRLHGATDVETRKEAEEALSYADSLTMCSGIGPSKEFEELHVNNIARLSGHQLFSAACNGAVSQDTSVQQAPRCLQCKKGRNNLKARLLRYKKKARAQLTNTAAKRLKYAMRTLRRRSSKLCSLQVALKKLQEKNMAIKTTFFEEKLKELPRKQQSAVRACFEVSRRKSNRGYRYN